MTKNDYKNIKRLFWFDSFKKFLLGLIWTKIFCISIFYADIFQKKQISKNHQAVLIAADHRPYLHHSRFMLIVSIHTKEQQQQDSNRLLNLLQLLANCTTQAP